MSHAKPKFVLVYDVGGSHISAGICEERTYTLRGLSRAPLPNESPAKPESRPEARFIRLIHALGSRTADSAGIDLSKIDGACLAFPGPFDYDLGVSQMRHKLSGIFGVDLKEALARSFSWQPSQFRFVNDAAAFLLGEIGAGAAKGFSRSIGITLGTGIGCSFAVDGVPVTHGPGVPPGGEIWNLPFDSGTVEDLVSTRFLRRHYQALSGLDVDVSDVAAIAHCQEELPCPELEASLAHQSKPAVATAGKPITAARQAFLDFGRNIGLVLNRHAAAFHPDVIVFGGGISRAAQLFLPATRRALVGIDAKLTISALMDEAALVGAGVHWFSA